jgi:hypothetical protein
MLAIFLLIKAFRHKSLLSRIKVNQLLQNQPTNPILECMVSYDPWLSSPCSNSINLSMQRIVEMLDTSSQDTKILARGKCHKITGKPSATNSQHWLSSHPHHILLLGNYDQVKLR